MHAKLVWFLGFGNPTGKRFDPERSQMQFGWSIEGKICKSSWVSAGMSHERST